MLKVIQYILHYQVSFICLFLMFLNFFPWFTNTWWFPSSAKMWGPGAEQGGIIQSSSCKLDLKEPYYRMSQPQPYAMAQDQQPHQQIHSQVSLPVIRIFFSLFELEFLCRNIMVLIKSTRVSRSKQKIKRSINARFCRAFVYILLPVVMIVTID